MKKQTLISAVFLFILIMTSALIMGSRSAGAVWEKGRDITAKLEIFASVLETIQRRYVEERSIDELLEAAMEGVIARLDPHTTYLPPDNFQRWNKSFEGFNGLGISYVVLENFPMVTHILDGSQAREAGMQVGDFITRIGESPLKGLQEADIQQLIREQALPYVKLTVMRHNVKEPLIFHLKRRHIQLKSIPVAFMLTRTTGYILLEKFTGETANELDEALDRLARQGMQELVLDLRDNGGGYLSAAFEVTNRFLPSNRMIVYTRGREPGSYNEYRSNGNYPWQHLPMTILINHGTASAAEIVAGALQDWDRALIVGTTSFGKGLVQSQYRFRDGSALLVTTAHYYTPLGRMIQRDYNNLTRDEYYYGAYDQAALDQREHDSSRSVYLTPNGRKVYGGGGITPDIRVHNDTAEIDPELTALFLADNKFFLRFAAQIFLGTPIYRRLPIRALKKRIRITEKQFQAFKKMVIAAGYPVRPGFFNEHRRDIIFLLKREIAYLAGGEQGRILACLDRDKQLSQAINTMAIINQYTRIDNNLTTALRNRAE